LQFTDLQCVLNLLNANTFKNNSASDQGGAIIWENFDYFEYEPFSIFENNSAIYGSNVGSYPDTLNIVFISNNDELNRAL